MSKSRKLREQGDESYQVGVNPDVSLTFRQLKLEAALKDYRRALPEAIGNEEMSLASKNVGMAAWKLAEIHLQLQKPATSTKMLFASALSNLIHAESVGQERDLEWLTEVKNAQANCLHSVIEWSVKSFEGHQRAAYLESIVNVVRHSHQKAKCYIAAAKALFFHSVVALEDGQYIKALTVLHDCHYPVEEAARLCRDDTNLTSQVDELRQDITTNLQIAESIQAVKTGDDILKKAVEDSEDLVIDMVWEAIDWYTKGLLSGREKQVEYEAKALSRMGYIYYKVLKVSTRAKTHFTGCMQLCLALSPKSPENEEWYKTCKQCLHEIQEAIMQMEDDSYQKQKELAMDELKSEFADLNTIETVTDIKEQLQKIYERFPRSDMSTTLLYNVKDEWDEKMMKKALQKALLHYHPDKVDVEMYGKNMKFLFQEITKILTGHLCCMKSI